MKMNVVCMLWKVQVMKKKVWNVLKKKQKNKK